MVKKNPQVNQKINCVKILTTYITNKRLTYVIYKEHLQINKK